MDSETRTHKRLRLMIDMLERKVRLRALQLYEQRGRQEGMALEDWITAEVDILGPAFWRASGAQAANLKLYNRTLRQI